MLPKIFLLSVAMKILTVVYAFLYSCK